jgi:membrane protease YdiL (CAAX protease family)
MITPSHPIEAPQPAGQLQEVARRSQWKALAYVMIGTFLIWLVLDRAAAWLGSLRGEAGLLVCAIVIVTALGVERLLFKTSFWQGAKRLGLGSPNPRVMGVTLGISLLMLAFYPLFSFVIGVPVSLRSDWPWLILGLFAQHGIAEEMLFRGFTFGHLREGRTFWRAAFLSLVPFVAIHLLLLASLDLPLALASIILAVASSLPLAYLFDRGYRTIWAPALLHFITHTIKLVDIPTPFYTPAAVAWIVICALLPYLVFVFSERFFTPDRSTEES